MVKTRDGLKGLLGSGLCAAVCGLATPARATPTLNVTQPPYNANTTGSSNDRVAIQHAIDDAFAAGGGTVLLPGGSAGSPKVYLTGGLLLKSNVTLHISEHAILKQSPNAADYTATIVFGKGGNASDPFPWGYNFYKNVPLLFANTAVNVGIEGDGWGHQGRISMTYGCGIPGSCDDTTIWMQAIGFLKVLGARVEAIDFDGLNSVSVSMYNVVNGVVRDSLFDNPNTLNSGPFELENSGPVQIIHNDVLGANDDAIALVAVGANENPWCGPGYWCNGVDPAPLHDVTIADNYIRVNRSGSALEWFPWGAADGLGIYNVIISDNTFDIRDSAAAVGCLCTNPVPDKGFAVNSQGQSPVYNVLFTGNFYSGNLTGLGSNHEKYRFDTLIARDFTIDPSDGLATVPYEPTRPRSLANQGFETGSLNAWSVQGSPGQITVTSMAGQSGSHSAHLAHYDLGYAAIWQGIKTTPGKSYTFKMRTKTSGSITRMYAYDTCTSSTIAWKTFNPTSWGNQSLAFTATTCPNIQLVIDTNANVDPTAFAQLDDMRVVGDYVDSEDPAVVYNGDWFNCSNPFGSQYGNNQLCTNADPRNVGYYQPYSHSTGAGLTATFEGTRASIIVGTGVNGGIMNVAVDGVSRGTVDLYSSSDVFQRAIYTTPVLSSGQHTIAFTNSGTTSHGGHDIYFDAIKVL